MNILSLGSHGVLEYDQVKLWSDLGYDVFSPGGYEEPAKPATDMRPAILTAPDHPELRALCHAQRVSHGADGIEYAIDWAKADLHPDLIDWADVIIVDCYPERWIASNWERIKGKRVIWRTIGQSLPEGENLMLHFRRQGLEIVRYSPAEKRAFESLQYAGEDAVIRFGKDPADWYGWTGEDARVLNFTQHDREPHGRDRWTNWAFWEAATKGLPAVFAGPNSEVTGGYGPAGYDEMRQMLRSFRAYLYTGTQPASYTLGLIEAMMTGIPVVSIGGKAWGWPELFEAHELAAHGEDDPQRARKMLDDHLHNASDTDCRLAQQQQAIDMFSTDTIGRQWLDYLGSPATVTWQTGEAVTA